jgi:hypothetical protein
VLYLIGSTMDWVEDDFTAGFVFNNPNAKGTCGCGESFTVYGVLIVDRLRDLPPSDAGASGVMGLSHSRLLHLQILHQALGHALGLDAATAQQVKRGGRIDLAILVDPFDQPYGLGIVDDAFGRALFHQPMRKRFTNKTHPFR